MKNTAIVLGYCPTRRDVFSRVEAIKFNKMIREKINCFSTTVIDLKGINEEELLFSDKDIENVIERFKQKK